MLSYINERLEIHRDITPFPSIIYGTTGSPFAEWETTIIDNDGGYRKAFTNRDSAIGQWNIGGRTYNLEEWEYLYNFFIDKRGSEIAFRYKDWSDFEAINEPVGIGDGCATIFQLKKTYLDYDRPIPKPVLGTVKIYFNEILQTFGYSIDYERAIITFAIAVTAGIVITASCEFDVRVRFETDDLPATFLGLDKSGEKFVGVGAIGLIEVLTEFPYVLHASASFWGGGLATTNDTFICTSSLIEVNDYNPPYTAVYNLQLANFTNSNGIFIGDIYGVGIRDGSNNPVTGINGCFLSLPVFGTCGAIGQTPVTISVIRIIQ